MIVATAGNTMAPAVQALSEVAKTLVLDLLSPAAKEGGLLLQEIFQSFRERRGERLNKSLEDANKFIVESNREARQVPEKILFPIFEGMSLEDDEELSRCWAALLATAATHEEGVRTAFATILTELSSSDAILLNQLFGSISSDSGIALLAFTKRVGGERTFSFPSGNVPANLLESGADTSYENLLRLGLIAETAIDTFHGPDKSINATSLGKEFYRAVNCIHPSVADLEQPDLQVSGLDLNLKRKELEKFRTRIFKDGSDWYMLTQEVVSTAG